MVGNRKYTVGVSSVCICGIIFITAFLSLKNISRGNLVAGSPYIILIVQVLLSSAILYTHPKKEVKKNICMTLSAYAFGAFFILALSSAFWSKFPELVFQRTLLIFVPLCFFGVLIFFDSRPIYTFCKVASGVIYFVMFFCLFALLIFFVGDQVYVDGYQVQRLSIGPINLMQRTYGSVPFPRVSSAFGNPNAFGSWIVMASSMLLFLGKAGIVTKMKLYALIATFSISLIISFSRTSIAAFILSCMVFYWFSPSTKIGWIFKILISFAFLLMLFFMISALLDSEGGRFSLSLNERDILWREMFDSIGSSPYFGIGFAVSSEAVLLPAGLDYSGHNAHLQILTELGAVGYLLFLMLWVTPTMLFIYRIGNCESGSISQYALIAIVSFNASLFFHQIFEGSFMRFGFHTVFWFYLNLLGLSLCITNKDTGNRMPL